MSFHWMLIVGLLLSGASTLLDRYIERQSDPTPRLKNAITLSDDDYAELDAATARRVKLLFLSAGLSLAAGAFALVFLVALTIQLFNQ